MGLPRRTFVTTLVLSQIDVGRVRASGRRVMPTATLGRRWRGDGLEVLGGHHVRPRDAVSLPE
eukprot:11179787-Lingulodinium_polyedra.AAC.1